jgi:hypothetical protein
LAAAARSWMPPSAVSVIIGRKTGAEMRRPAPDGQVDFRERGGGEERRMPVSKKPRAKAASKTPHRVRGCSGVAGPMGNGELPRGDHRTGPQ